MGKAHFCLAASESGSCAQLCRSDSCAPRCFTPRSAHHVRTASRRSQPPTAAHIPFIPSNLPNLPPVIRSPAEPWSKLRISADRCCACACCGGIAAEGHCEDPPHAGGGLANPAPPIPTSVGIGGSSLGQRRWTGGSPFIMRVIKAYFGEVRKNA